MDDKGNDERVGQDAQQNYQYDLDERLKRLVRLLAREAAREFVEEQANDKEERE